MKKSYQRKNKKIKKSRSKKGSGNLMTTSKNEEEIMPSKSKGFDKEKYIKYLIDEKDYVAGIYLQFENILKKSPDREDYLNNNMENLTIKTQTYLSKYADDAELLRSYVKNADMLLKLDETQDLPEEVKSPLVGILVLFKKYPFLIQLGSSSPQEELDNDDDVSTEDVTRFEEIIERVNQRIKKKEGGKKSRKKKRKSRKKSRRKKRKHQ